MREATDEYADVPEFSAVARVVEVVLASKSGHGIAGGFHSKTALHPMVFGLGVAVR
jgi:hypothetical protein